MIGPNLIDAAAAKQAIVALRDGIPPSDNVLDKLTVGQDRILDVFRTALAIVEQGGFQARLLVGVPGSGKSHLLHYLRRLAAHQNCVVSYCTQDLAAGATLNRPDTVYRELARNFRLPTPTKNVDAISHLLSQWGGKALPITRYRNPSMGRVYPLASAGLIPPLHQLPRRTGLALIGFVLALEAGDGTVQQIMLNVLRGLPLENRSVIEAAKQVGLKRAGVGYTPSPYDSDYWFGQFSTLCHIARTCGFTGTVLILDELESLVDLTRSSSRRKAYAVLHDLFFNDHKAPGLFSAFAFTPAFVTGLRADIEAEGDRFYRDWRGLWADAFLEIERLSNTNAYELARRISRIYQTGHRVDDAARLEGKLVQICTEWSKSRAATGELVRRIVSTLDMASKSD